jgi:hypothetical protein
LERDASGPGELRPLRHSGERSARRVVRVRPRGDPAHRRLSKPIWLAILGGTGLVSVFLPPPVGSAIAACAIGIYLVDVRPKILEVQGKSR